MASEVFNRVFTSHATGLIQCTCGRIHYNLKKFPDGPPVHGRHEIGHSSDVRVVATLSVGAVVDVCPCGLTEKGEAILKQYSGLIRKYYEEIEEPATADKKKEK